MSQSHTLSQSHIGVTSALTKFALLLSVALWLTMFVKSAGDELWLATDFMYLYDCGAEFVHPGLHQEQVALVDGVVRSGGDDQLVYRATLRASYCNNYLVASLSSYTAGRILSRLGIVNAKEDMGRYLIYALYWGMFVSGALIGLAVLFTAFRVRQDELRISVASAVIIAAILVMAVPPAYTTWLFYQGSPAPPAPLVKLDFVWWHYLQSWVSVGRAYRAFGITPRANVCLLALAAFVLRWNGQRGLAYSIPIAVGFVHQSTALILLVVMIFCDFVTRPRVLLEWRCAVPLLLSAALIVLREHMLRIMNLEISPIFVVLVLGLAAAAFILIKKRGSRILALWSPVASFRDRTIGAVPEPLADATLIMLIWVTIIPFIYALAHHDAWYRTVYFWSELPPRYAGTFQLCVFAGFLFPLWNGLTARYPRAAGVLSVFVCLAAVAAIAFALRVPPKANLEAKSELGRRYDNSIVAMAAKTKKPEFRDEAVWYYLLARKAAAGDGDIRTLFDAGPD